MAKTSTPKLSNKVWLLRGLFFSAPGILELNNGQLSFTLTDTGAFWPPQLRALEKMAKRPGLASAIEQGESALVFSVPVNSIEVNFPWYNFNGGVMIVVDNVSYRFSFLQPQNTKMPEPAPEELIEVAETMMEGGGEILDGMQVGKAWKAALAGV